MSTTEIRTEDTDKYIVLTQYDSSNNLEVALTQALVQSAYQKTAIDTSSGTYISPANDSSWNCVDLSNNFINTSAISNYPSGTLTEYSVITSNLSQDISLNTYNTVISDASSCGNNSYDFTTLGTSAAIYDGNYVVTQNLIADCSDNQAGNFVTGTFDVDASNAKIQYAMQSRWNTILGPYPDLDTSGADPTSIQQDFSNNTTISFAYKGTGATDASYESYWYDVSASDGSLVPHLIDASYQPIYNDFLVADRDLSGVTFDSNDIGIFRVQQPTNTITTIVTVDDVSNNITLNDLNNMPLFDGRGTVPLAFDSSKNSLPLPGAMTDIDFMTLFNNNVGNTVSDFWTFTIDISTNDGGYSVDGSNTLMQDLNNDNLLDNPYYMEKYVSKVHQIAFSNSTVTIDASTNGVQNPDANSINVDLSNGETLDASYAGVDGQFIINTSTIDTRYTDLSSVDVSGIDVSGGIYYPQVYYPSDDASAQHLTAEEMENPFFQGMWQKVAQNTPHTDSSYWIKTDSSAIMTLYDNLNGIVDDDYNETDFDFSFNNSSLSNNDINLWKITGTNNIITNPQSLYQDPSYTIVETGFSTAGVIHDLTDDLSYNNYRFLLTAKTKEDLSLYTAVTDVSGWDLNYDPSSNTYLTSNSDEAYSASAFPSKNVNSDIMNYLQAGNDISYSYTYYTVQDVSSGIGGLVDYVDISYNYNGQQQLIKITQSDITRTYNPLFNDISYVQVPDASYSFDGGFYNKSNWELHYVTATSKYDSSFPAKFGPLSNIKLKVNNINQTDTYYAILNKNSNNYAPASALRYVDASGISDLTDINEVISPQPGNSLQINGNLTRDDIKPFDSILQGTDNSDNWLDIGTTKDMDVYYGLINEDTVSTSANLSVIVQYSSLNSSLNSLSLQNYYIPFVYDQSNNSFILESYSVDASAIVTDLSSGSFLDNTSYLNLTDGYTSINSNSWKKSEYTLTIDTSGGSTTFIATNNSSQEVFRITTLDYTIFLATYLISYIPHDFYRVERKLGSSYLDSSYNESFLDTSYNEGKVSLYPTLEGLYINDGSANMALDNSPTLGGYQSFRIEGDHMAINLVGTTSDPSLNTTQEFGSSSFNSGSLSFQYVDGAKHSAQLTFPKYRGYQSFGLTNPYQYYTITRDSTSANFNVYDLSGGLLDLQDTLTTNMYYQESFVVDELRDVSDNNLVANLGVTSSFNYSIPPASSALTYIINVSGDSVNVSINNPNYLGDASNVVVPIDSTPVVDPKLYSDSMTLKDYGQNDVYTFSGTWTDTTQLMSVRPSRVKLSNSAYPYDSFSYEIQMLATRLPVYKARSINLSLQAFNWLGNPALKGSQDANTQPSADDWELIATYDPSAIYLDPSTNTGGINIGKKVLYQNPEAPLGYRLVYIVSTPTYYKFEQISTDSCPVIPYDYDVSYVENRTQRYMPFIDTTSGNLVSAFNPFATTVSYTDVCGNTTNVLNDSTILNNVTFTLSSTINMIDAASTNTYDTTRYGIIVPGTNLTVSEYIGFYPGTNSPAHTDPIIWTGPVTSIPSTPDINNNTLIFRNRDASGGINFSALQYPSAIGYPSGAAGYEEVFRTDISSNWYNIDFYIGNSAWFNNNNPVTYFNVNTHGIAPTLYTVEDINDSLTQTNKRRIYKYGSAFNIDIDASNTLLTGYQTFNLTFNSRSYYDFDISMNGSFGSSGIWKYNDILNNTVIPDASITWNTDVSYGTTNSYVSWAFGNSTTATRMLIELFSVQDTQSKWSYIHLKPFMRYLNQFNMQVGSIAWDGSVTAPLVNTSVLSLAAALSEPPLKNNTYTTQQYSESTL